MIEGDDLHPAGNVEKMRRGEPLSDEDRWPWLEALAQAASGHLKGEKDQEGKKGQEVQQEDLQAAVLQQLLGEVFPVVAQEGVMEGQEILQLKSRTKVFKNKLR